jgi:hypothetical protein
MLDEIVWWANTLKEGRSRDEVAQAAWVLVTDPALVPRGFDFVAEVADR